MPWWINSQTINAFSFGTLFGIALTAAVVAVAVRWARSGKAAEFHDRSLQVLDREGYQAAVKLHPAQARGERPDCPVCHRPDCQCA